MDGQVVHNDTELEVGKLTLDNTFTAQDVAKAYSTSKKEEESKLLGLTLFPIKRVAGQKFDMFFRDTKKPKVIKGTMADTAAPIRSGKKFEKITIDDLPRFREAYVMDETRQIELMQIFETQNQDLIINHIANDYEAVIEIIEGVPTQYERMAMLLLSYGKINFVSAGVPISYDYNLDTEQIVTLTGTDMFSDTVNSDPLALIAAEVKEMRDAGKDIGGMVLNSSVWNNMLINENTRSKLSTIPGQKVNVDDDMLKKYLKDKLKLTPYVYDKVFEDEEGVTRKYYADNRITLIENVKQGFTGAGTTIEEANKLLKRKENIAVLKNGTAIKGNYNEKDETKDMQVSAVGLPIWTKHKNIKILIVQ